MLFLYDPSAPATLLSVEMLVQQLVCRRNIPTEEPMTLPVSSFVFVVYRQQAKGNLSMLKIFHQFLEGLGLLVSCQGVGGQLLGVPWVAASFLKTFLPCQVCVLIESARSFDLNIVSYLMSFLASNAGLSAVQTWSDML